MPEIQWMRLTAPELREAAKADALVILPVASLEQHGPHMATGTDMVLGGAVARATAERIDEAGEPVLVLPVVWHGLAEHHMAYGGTITLDQPTFLAVLKGIAASVARHGFSRLFLLNAHGGNTAAIDIAVNEIGRDLPLAVMGGTYWHIVPEAIEPLLEDQPGLMHACEAETSLMLHLTEGCVRHDRLPGAFGPMATRAPGQPRGLVVRRSFAKLSQSGVFGDARRASAEKGAALLDAIADALAPILMDAALWRSAEKGGRA
jgi:creatinine amidohydrolase